MNNDKDENFDDLFKKGLVDPGDHIRYKEQDWNALEQMLDNRNKRKGIVYLLPVLSGVAALLLLFLGWWIFQPKAIPANRGLVKNNTRQQTIKGNKTTTPGVQSGNDEKVNANSSSNSGDNVNKTASATYATTAKGTTGSADYATVTQGTTGSADLARTHINRNKAAINKLRSNVPVSIQLGTAQQVKSDQLPSEALAATSVRSVLIPGSINAPLVSTDNLIKPVSMKSIETKNPIVTKQRNGFRPRYAISVLAAPDLNGVGSFQQSKVGTNFGLLFSAGVSKRLTISTGAIYSAKPYSIAFEDYHTKYQFPVDPSNVTATCNMLDIPLNVDYQVFNKKQNKISIGTGLSSYLMLHENYQFSYNNPYAYGPASYTVPHSDNYFFGVLNLNATYQRQLNSKVGLTVQPYLKLPLTNLGYGQVRLQTTGVAVGLSWNINSLRRP